jgi:hypothetical protein
MSLRTSPWLRLTERLNARRFPPDDPLYRAAPRAKDGIHELCVVLHYLTSDGVGQSTRGS